jgi:hypothetical protein
MNTKDSGSAAPGGIHTHQVRANPTKKLFSEEELNI